MFATLVREHPEYEITVLLRNPPASFESQFPNVRLIIGDFDSYESISDAAAEADIVIRKWEPDPV